MTNKFLEQKFKELIYDFGEVNWDIIKTESWDKYINNQEPFTEKQFEDLRHFVKNLLDCLTDEQMDETDKGSLFYCQSDIETGDICDSQCDHCKEYYKPNKKVNYFLL